MSRTPAAELARLKVAFPEWSIRRNASGTFTARRKLPSGRAELVRGATLPELEYRLRQLDQGALPG